jgi:hypothetical protein
MEFAVIGENAVKDDTLFGTVKYKGVGSVIILAVLDCSIAIPSAVLDGATAGTIAASVPPLVLEKGGFLLGFGVNLYNCTLVMSEEIRYFSTVIHVEFLHTTNSVVRDLNNVGPYSMSREERHHNYCVGLGCVGGH